MVATRIQWVISLVLVLVLIGVYVYGCTVPPTYHVHVEGEATSPNTPTAPE